jgi:hypothetical protein
MIGSLLGGAFTCLIRWLRWPPDVISIAPISIMFGVLSYTVTAAVYFFFTGSFSPQAILGGITVALFFTWPIAFVIGPLLLIYIVNLKNGRKALKDSTVFYLAGLCLISDFMFLIFFFKDA